MCIVTAYMIFNIFAIPQRARNMDKSLFIYIEQKFMMAKI